MNEIWEPSSVSRPDAEFKLSITRALADQLERALEALTPAPLVDDIISSLTAVPGVYQLYDGKELVYVGKASKSLVQRLGKHRVKLAGRNVRDIRFVCLYVDEDLEASAPEKMLIKRHKATGGAAWNYNGFGSNDPGFRRDETAVKSNHFDALHPIDLDYRIALSSRAAKTGSVAAALRDIKKQSPYLLRFQKSAPKVLGKTPLIDSSAKPMSAWLPTIVEALPDGWQATALPGYVILYEVSDPNKYPSAMRYWRKVNGAVVEIETSPTWDAPGEIDDEGDDDSQDSDADDNEDDD